jgi:uncharacterized damage-inducible protein DinB
MVTSAVAVLQRLHQHRAWVNGNLLAAAGALREEELFLPFAIGQGSIWKSLLHMYAAEFVWLGALEGDEEPLVQGDLPGRLPGNQLGEGKIASFAELRERWLVLERRWVEYLENLRPEALDDVVYKVSSSVAAGKRFGTRRLDVLLHVCTHAHYTAAQVINMLRQSGVEKLPESMLISLSRSETGPA